MKSDEEFICALVPDWVYNALGIYSSTADAVPLLSQEKAKCLLRQTVVGSLTSASLLLWEKVAERSEVG